jgi:sphinganine-1-phosphate aldolase
MTGSRGGGPIGASWATLLSIGIEGYLEQTKDIMETSKYLQEGINKIKELKIIGKPNGSIFSFASTEDDLNIYSIGDIMEEKFNWKIETQQKPSSIHCTILPCHSKTKDLFLEDLKKSIEIYKSDKKKYEKNGNLYFNFLRVF